MARSGKKQQIAAVKRPALTHREKQGSYRSQQPRHCDPMDGRSNSGAGKHFVLVHGLCHGAWCWYKLVPMLSAAGHRVTALDLAASGAHSGRMDEVASFEDYSRPLLDAVADAGESERLVLVGHSLGGLSLALAMERFPRRVAAAVFLTAGMPRAGRALGIIVDEFNRRMEPDFFMDSEMMVVNTSQGPRATVVCGPKLLAAKLYDQSSPEDLALATMLMRPGSQFMDDPIMKDETLLTEANYGSVKKVFVVVNADACISGELQRWMVDLSPGTETEEIAGADHMAMCSRPRELCDVLVRIANKV